jgi:mono/diheme cytochrome c family protein
MLILANTYRNIGYVLAAVLTIAFVVYLFLNYRKARPETGAEIELASNRKPYYEDEELETKKLDATLGIGLATLAVIAVALPMYWLAEPGRQEGAVEQFDSTFVHRGEELYNEFCSSCHAAGAVGGVAPYTLTDDEGNFIAAVEWKVPALNTVLMRYSREEVEFVLNYGRRNTPMPPWGLPGGGPMTEQQVQNVIDYLETIQLSETDVRTEVRDGLIDAYVESVTEAENARRADAGQGELEDAELDALTEEAIAEVEERLDENVFDIDLDEVWTTAELGEALFNLEASSGTYSCARCHTKGWSYDEPEVSGGGFLGPNLTNGATLRQFPSFQSHVAFIIEGSESGQPFGAGGNGSGQMPSFGFNPNAEEEDSKLAPEQFMLTIEQIEAIVEYERGL